ncbi:hypothetical protein ENUP19_0281G0015 [Entamoeba nuttalli]|uniref:TBC/Rab GTPase activating domain containing protein n=2 Tax=Entamoeba nuttalli TaxID=412467 RepID=K2HR42_ENTNP|nr:TBC/Rab GTPase activating domain containing protein [Entamoeba nuttalli P19]EKE38455.1 TBC/Rab GTPase activating domain containing protein [Entamoeba nuttalli P19]|eukprot:XP_008859206.1 TBC/Rab GTPase activating domain containing protein [Entamoeba nuttalli P19]
MSDERPLVEQRKFAKPLPQNRVKTLKKEQNNKGHFPVIVEEDKSGRKSPSLLQMVSKTKSKSKEDLSNSTPTTPGKKGVDKENSHENNNTKDQGRQTTKDIVLITGNTKTEEIEEKKIDYKPRQAIRTSKNQDNSFDEPTQSNGSTQIPSGIVLSVKHTHHMNSKTELLGFIQDVRVKVNDQWMVKGVVNLTSLNGFVYFDFIPIKMESIFDLLSRHWQNPVNDINEYKVDFCFRDCIGIKYKQTRKSSLLMPQMIYEVSFEFSSVLPFSIPIYQFESSEGIELMLKSISKKGIKLILDKGDDKEGYYKVETKLCNNESFRKSMSMICLYTKKVNEDPIRITSRKQWMNSHTLDISSCTIKYIEVHNQMNEVKNAVKYVGCDDESRCIAWMICEGEMKDYSKKNDVLNLWKKKYETLQLQWNSFFPEQKKRWKDINSIETQIEKDLNRTVLNNVQWTDKPVEALKRILMCYGIYDMETMYVQGMNEICALCMEYSKNELESFIIFYLIMKLIRPFYLIQTNASASLNKLQVIIQVLDKEIADAFSKAQVDYMFCWRSIALLFKRELNPQDIKRVWDFILAKPEDKMFLFVMAAILSMHREFILTQDLDFDIMMQFTLTLTNVFDYQLIWDADILCNEFKSKASKEQIDIVFGN